MTDVSGSRSVRTDGDVIDDMILKDTVDKTMSVWMDGYRTASKGSSREIGMGAAVPRVKNQLAISI